MRARAAHRSHSVPRLNDRVEFRGTAKEHRVKKAASGTGGSGEGQVQQRNDIQGARVRAEARSRHRTGRQSKLTREIIAHPGSVVVLPVFPDGRILMIRQYRHAAGQYMWELVAGHKKNGENFPRRRARASCWRKPDTRRAASQNSWNSILPRACWAKRWNISCRGIDERKIEAGRR